MTTIIKEEEAELFVKKAVGEMDIGGYMVPALNAPIILLDTVRNLLLADHVPFAVMYWDEPECRMFVLLSDHGGIDVGEIAKAHGGSGVQMTGVFKTPPQKEVVGEMIPLALETPPDNMTVLVMFMDPISKTTFICEAPHHKDGQFDVEDADNIVAWAYLPELSDSIEIISDHN